jgi:DNA-binding NarL/FixJ family response regulator
MELAGLIAEGKSNKEIARMRDRSVATVKGQISTMLSRTGAVNRAQLVTLILHIRPRNPLAEY